MDLKTEIARYQALLRYAVDNDESIQRELHYQVGILRALGADDGKINDVIHDRHSREGISRARAEVVLASIRQAAGLAQLSKRSWAAQSSGPTIAAQTAEYMRKTGRGPRRNIEGSPFPAALRAAVEVQAALTPRRTPCIQPIPSEHEDVHKDDQPGWVQVEETLAVPYALDPASNIIRAQDAVSGVSYTCLGCASALSLKAGQHRTKHFAHKVGTSCDGESVIHMTAKVLVAKVICENASAAIRIRLSCTCSSCSQQFDKELDAGAFNGAIVEGKVDGFRCDVVALRDNREVLAVEILNTHAVDEHKAEALSIPWLEVKAAEIIENPYYWRIVNGKLKSTVCGNCRAADLGLRAVASRWNLPLPASPYVAAAAPCWGCKEEILWYCWPGVPFATDHPPLPVPHTVQFRYSKMYGGSYWMNVCPGCGAPQGDNFVFLAADSPFSRFRTLETDEMRQQRIHIQTDDAVELFKAVLRKNF